MKKTLFFLFLFPLLLTAQEEYSYEITSEEGDSTFQLDVITTINATRSQIQRTTGLDTVALQTRQYAEINRQYERIARLRREIDDAARERNVLLQSLNGLGLNDYVVWQRVRNDSTFAGVWSYRDENATVTTLNAQTLDDLPTRLRLEDNTLVAIIVPLSRNFIRLTWQAGYGDGDVFTEMYSNNGRLYIGETGDGNRIVLRWVRFE